jgi:hypothetical protein
MIAMGLNLEWLRQHDSAAKLLVSQDRQAAAMGMRVIVAPTDVAPVEIAHPI